MAPRISRLLNFDLEAAKGFEIAAGVDEAGRGPLAGPVMAAAVILLKKNALASLNDSKQLTAEQRQNLFPQILRNGLIGIGVANIINSLDPEIMVLGGGGITSGGISIEIVQETAKNYIISPLAKNTPIVKGVLGEYAQAMGAALLA